ncbi:phage shock protein C (PspC) family protein [Kribbella amoyensis]|uniref:Phage shock protein C (PspC) family protein n=1 Tax=Kribbella amoyensis TaxID=996641 RepID=A0A561BSF5_9ACTN|nr:PspC domain-containing protein [Kribbella amoyensis]TWD81827.1 phage shock protein C (PspC) family protein [Kribbella amoyensis]
MEQNQRGFDRDQLRDVQSWRRSRSDRMVAGVCGGIGRALNIDPVLVRVVMGVLIVSGPGLLFYAAAWLLMPDEGSDRSAAQGLLGDRVRPDHPWLWPGVIGACVFLAIALMSSFNFGKLVPGPIIVLGLLWLFVFRRKGKGPNWSHGGLHWTGRNEQRPQDTPQQWTPPAAGTTPTAAAQSAAPRSGPSAPLAGPSSSATQRPQDRTVEPVQPVWTEDDPLGLYVDEPPAAPPTAKPAAAKPPVKGYRGVKPAIVALTGLALGIAWLAQASTAMILAIGLVTLGAGMLIGGFLGKTLGLLPLGILLAVGVAVATVFPKMPRDFEDTNFTAPATHRVTATNTTYQFDAGSVQLDLTQATFDPGAKIAINGGLGEVRIKLPANVDVTGTVAANAGEVNGFGQHKGGHEATMALSDLGKDGKPGPSAVAIDVDMDLGSITVERG